MPRVHVIARGECLSSVAFRYGYFPGTIWEHPDNDAIRELRGDPNVLFEGDKLVLPDKEPKTTECATGKRHRFQRRGVPARFRLQLLNADKPRPNLAYKLTIDDRIELTGATSADGLIDVPIPPDARYGLLHLEEDDADFELYFGHLDPMDEGRGLRQRLANLGHLRADDPDSASEDDVTAAIKSFQLHAKLDPTGELDNATSDKLYRGHDVKQ
jgi:Putative peptidoglycan binding domain